MTDAENKEPSFPEGWRVLYLEDVAEIIDSLHKTPRFESTGIPMVRATEVKPGFLRLDNAKRVSNDVFNEFIKKYRPKKGDIVLGRVGSIGLTSYVNTDEPFCLGQNTAIISSKIDSRFLFYCLQSPFVKNQIDIMKVGTSQFTISLENIRKIRVQTCDASEAESIANILGALDDKSEINRRMSETLESMARTIFKSWFIDFDPVRAKAEGKQPFGMDEETAALFPSEFEDSELGEIPKGWKNATIFEFADLNAWTLSKNDAFEMLDYIEISEVSKGDIANIKTFRRGEEPSRARRRLRHGDTAISTVRPDRGSYFLCLNPSDNLIASTGFAVVTPKIVPWSFIYTVLTQPSIFEFLGQQADGGAYPAVRPEVIGNIQFVMPNNMELLKKYHEIISHLLEMAHYNRNESKTLSILRDALLPKLLSGELRVPVAEVSNLQAGLDVSAPAK